MDPNTLSVHGLENADPNFVQRATSVIADFIPYIGTGKSITELLLGYDPITGEKVHFVVAGFGIIGSFVPIPGAAKACKFMGKGFVLGAEFIAKNPEIFGKKVIGRNVNKISNEPPDFIKKFWPNYKRSSCNAQDMFSRIETPFGLAKQSLSKNTIEARVLVENGTPLYRGGVLGKSAGPEAQFWSLENPLDSNYAVKYGIPIENMKFDFIEKGATFITREAPGIGLHSGGGIEIITNPNSVVIEIFNMP